MNSAFTLFAFSYYFSKEFYVPLWLEGVRFVTLSRFLPDEGVFLRPSYNLCILKCYLCEFYLSRFLSFEFVWVRVFDKSPVT